MSQSIISQKSSQQVQYNPDYRTLYQKFLNFHFHNHVFKKGIVFVGNSRIGKSTLSGLFWGMKMRIRQLGHTLKVQPAEQHYRLNQNLIRHTLASVTQFPNIYSKIINDQQFTIVDLPGFKDTCYLKQLCNWYYIKSILQKMADILFVMVVQIHNQGRQVKEKDIQMMQRFMQAFPSKVNGTAKQNLVVIINFVQSSALLQTQALKRQIKQRLFQKFRIIDNKNKNTEKMETFYSKIFANDKVHFFQKVSNKENHHQQFLKEGVEFNEPKLVQFITNNLNCIQKTDQSDYKLKNTKSNDKKADCLRTTIVQLAQFMQKSIGQKFQQLKNFFSHILNRLSQTKGVTLFSQDMEILNCLVKKQKIEVLDRMHQQQQIVSYRFNQILNPSELVLKIVSFFKIMNQNQKINQEQSFPVAIDYMKQNFRQFITILLKLSSQIFDPEPFTEIQKVMNRIWKSICIQTKIWLFLNESVQDFERNEQQNTVIQFFTKMNKNNLGNLNKKMPRVSNFSNALLSFLNNQIRLLGDISPKKVDLQFQELIIQACTLMRFKQLRTSALGLKYKFIHQIINHININIDFNNFQDALRRIELTWKQHDQKDSDFYKWTQDANNQKWGLIKLQSFLNILRFISKTKQDPKTIFQLYTSINACHYQLFQYLKGLLVQNRYQKQNKQQVGRLLIDAGDYFKRQFKKTYAFECYQIAANICFPQFMDNCQQANQKSLKLNQNDVNINQYKWKWGQISDNQFKNIVSLAIKNVSKQKQSGNLKRFRSVSQRSNLNLAINQFSPQTNSPLRIGKISHPISQFQPASQNKIMHKSQNRINHINDSQSQTYSNQHLVSPCVNNKQTKPAHQIKFRQFI